jgi:hypothetical protein
MARWIVPAELSAREVALCARMKTAGKLFVFLRNVRHELFDEATQAELEMIHAELPRGTAPVPVALMATVILLQAYTKASDEEAVRRASMDAAWKMVLGTLDSDKAPFSKTTLVRYRAAFIARSFDALLLRRTVEMASKRQGFDPKALRSLRIAVDSAPLEGAGRVEDTYNLLARALRIVVKVMALLLMIVPESVRQGAGLRLLAGSSLKAMLDMDWDQPDARDLAVGQILDEGDRLVAWAERLPHTWLLSDPMLQQARAQVARIVAQDVERGPDGRPHLIQGVARDRQISIHDPDMRHGHKTRSQAIAGYKRYEAVDLDTLAVVEAVVLPANEPEHLGADKMRPAIAELGQVGVVQVDRAFLPSSLVTTTHAQGGEVICRPYQMGKNQSERFGKGDFAIDTVAQTVRCPAGNVVALRAKTTLFSAKLCQNCPLREECVGEKKGGGRSVPIHPQESMLQALSAYPRSEQGRAQLRKRTEIEHRLAHLCARQGPRARYWGTRKNDFDVRRAAAVDNLFLAARIRPRAA